MSYGTQFGSLPFTNDRQAGSPVAGLVMTSMAFKMRDFEKSFRYTPWYRTRPS